SPAAVDRTLADRCCGDRCAHCAARPAHPPTPRGGQLMSERRWLRTTRVLASTVTGVGVVALAGAGVAGGILWQAPESTPAPAPAVEVGAASLPLVCPPAPVVPTGDGGDIDYDEAFGTGGAEA